MIGVPWPSINSKHTNLPAFQPFALKLNTGPHSLPCNYLFFLLNLRATSEKVKARVNEFLPPRRYLPGSCTLSAWNWGEKSWRFPAAQTSCSSSRGEQVQPFRASSSCSRSFYLFIFLLLYLFGGEPTAVSGGEEDVFQYFKRLGLIFVAQVCFERAAVGIKDLG